jgi:hypothetical protein
MPNLFRRCRGVLLCTALLTTVLRGAQAQDKAAQDFLQARTPLPEPRQLHSAAAVGDFLYVIGGSTLTEAATTSVIRARIDGNGNLSDWQPATPLPEPRLYTSESTVALGRFIYVMGGAVGILNSKNSSSGLIARVQPDGTLSNWIETAPFATEGVTAPTTVVTPGYLHVIGGVARKTIVQKSVHSAAVLPNGTLDAWFESPELPKPLWYHHSAVSAGRAYVWGGLDGPANTSVSTAVYSAPIQGDGRIGAWREESVKMPGLIYAGSTSVAGPYLMTFSPRYAGKKASNDVYWATANSAGISEWTPVQTTVPNRIYHASTTDYRHGIIYLIGGRTSAESPKDYIPDIYVFRLSKKARDAAYLQGLQTGRVSDSAEDIGTGTTDGGAFAAAGAGGGASIAGFLTYEQAKKTPRPMVIYFHSPSAKLSLDQLLVTSDPRFAELKQRFAIALVDVAQDPQFAQQFGVWRVPTWLFFDKAGLERRRLVGLMNIEQLAEGTGAPQN